MLESVQVEPESECDASNTQDYYRYAYVYNNPLSNVDPSGFDCQTVTPGGSTTVTLPGDIQIYGYSTADIECTPDIGPPEDNIEIWSDGGGGTQSQAQQQQDQQQQTLQQCIDAVNAANNNSNNNSDQNVANKVLNAAGTDQALIQGSSKAIQNASPSAVGALMGFTPGVALPTNAGVRAVGSTLQAAMENADPYIKSAGKGLGIVSVGLATYQGYESGGGGGAVVNGGYATADAFIAG